MLAIRRLHLHSPEQRHRRDPELLRQPDLAKSLAKTLALPPAKATGQRGVEEVHATAAAPECAPCAEPSRPADPDAPIIEDCDEEEN